MTINSITKYDELFQRYALEFSLNWKWLKAIAMIESSLGENPLVKAGKVGTDGLSYGLMQVTITNAKSFGIHTDEEMNDPETQVEMACRILKSHSSVLTKNNSYSLEGLIRSYNGGFQKISNPIKSGKFVWVDRVSVHTTKYWNKFQKYLSEIK